MSQQPLRVLIAEDNPSDAELVLRELRHAGFDPDWHRVEDEKEYLSRLLPDLDVVISDYEMPQFSGPRALELLQQSGLDVPFIIVSGTIGEDVAVEVMRQGAADYLLKDRLARLGLAVTQAITQSKLKRERRQLQDEVALRDQRLNAFFTGAAAGLVLLDKNLRFVQVNETLAEINGLPTRDHLGRTVREVLPKLAPVIEPLFRKILATGEPILGFELTGETPLKPGVQRHWIESLFPIAGIDGRPDGIGAIVVEITERKIAEESLRVSEERFRQLAENIQEVFWITDVAKNKMLYISPAYEVIWARTCESLYASPRNWVDAIHPDDRERVLEAATSRQIKGTYDEEYRIMRPDGTVRWIHDRAFPVRDAAGEVYRVTGVAQDITERRRSEHKLREQASLLDKAQDAILVRDLQHRITYWNKSAERLYGWSAAEAQGRSVTELLYSDDASFNEATRVLIETGEWIGELRQVNKSGGEVLVEGRWTLVRDDNGEPRSVLAINTDITEKKRIEAQFLRAQRLESIGTLAGGIAHDLNNVLTPITMSIDILKGKVTDQKSQDMLAMIAESAKRGAEMVGQVLSFARGMEGRRVEIQARHIIGDVVKIAKDTFPKSIVIRTAVPLDLWTLQGDPTQLHQVLLNLGVNARDAMPVGGEITISAGNKVLDAQYAAMNIEARPGPHILIEVKDTGTGISAEVIDKIFDPFFTTKEIGKGTGLGLSTSLAIIRSHGGFVRVKSSEGAGTTFQIYLPSLGEASDAAQEICEVEMPRGNGQTVLVVDDEDSIRQITRQTLEAYGYKVMLANDGAEAVAVYARHKAEIDIVLTDMMMPFMDGASTIQVLLKMNPKIRIIAASGLTPAGGVAKLVAAGVKHFVPKPYTADTLLRVFHECLES